MTDIKKIQGEPEVETFISIVKMSDCRSIVRFALTFNGSVL